MDTRMIPWLLLAVLVYVLAWRYCLAYRHKHRTRSELIVAGAGFLVMFVGWSLFADGLTWPRLLTSVWIGLSSGLSFGAVSRLFDKLLSRAKHVVHVSPVPLRRDL